MKFAVKAFLFCFLLLYSPSCTMYTEKQSEALSKVIYASKDSIDTARIDLADHYINEATRMVKPPKQRIEVQPIYKKEQSTVISNTKSTALSNKRVVVIPEKYRNDLVIVVKSEDYEKLLADKDVLEQFKKDNAELLEAKKTVDDELIKQAEYKDQIIKDLNNLQRQIAEKDLKINQRNIVIIGLVTVVGAGIYLKVKQIVL
jgi:hypothetical protein